MPQQDKFDESAKVEEVKSHLLDAVMSNSPSQDVLNLAAAYQYIVNTEKIKADMQKVEK